MLEAAQRRAMHVARAPGGRRRAPAHPGRRSLRGADGRSRRAIADEIDGAFQVARRAARARRRRRSATRATARSSTRSARPTTSRARRCSTTRKRAVYDRELAGGELVQVAAGDRHRARLPHRRGADGAAAVGAGDRPSQDRDRALAERGRLPRRARLGGVDGRRRARPRPPTPRARTSTTRSRSTPITPPRTTTRAASTPRCAATTPRRCSTSSARSISIRRAPTRLATIEKLLIARGELRRLERVLKRLLFRLRGSGTPAEAKAWVAARASSTSISSTIRPAGAAAVANARKIAPSDPRRRRARRAPRASCDRDANEPVRAGWREALADPQSRRGARALDRGAAATPTRRSSPRRRWSRSAPPTPRWRALYEQQRAARRAVADAAARSRSLGAAAPQGRRRRARRADRAGRARGPRARADDARRQRARCRQRARRRRRCRRRSRRLRAQLRRRCSASPRAPVYARVELGSQIHVVASDPPVLVAGDEALTAPERPELVFRLARAMTFLWPGRAVGASRPGRVLRAIVLAIFREARGSDDRRRGAARAAARPTAVAALSDAGRASRRAPRRCACCRAAAALNLSVWARSLSRTADRAGMLLCGDVPAAFAGAKEVGELDRISSSSRTARPTSRCAASSGCPG